MEQSDWLKASAMMNYGNPSNGLYKQLRIVFVPPFARELLAGVNAKTLHELYTCVEQSTVGLEDAAYLVAFNNYVSKVLNYFAVKCNEPICTSEVYSSNQMVRRLASTQEMEDNIVKTYFTHNGFIATASDFNVPQHAAIQTELYNEVELTVNYVIVPEQALITKYTVDTGAIEGAFEAAGNVAVQQHLNLLRHCLIPFHIHNSRESIAAKDPIGAFSLYLSLLKMA